jgi:hypothetical protein
VKSNGNGWVVGGGGPKEIKGYVTDRLVSLSTVMYLNQNLICTRIGAGHIFECGEPHNLSLSCPIEGYSYCRESLCKY